MRCQWISRVLGNNLIEPDAVMEPFAREVLARVVADGQPLVLIEATEGPIGFGMQKDRLEAVTPWLPGGVPVCLMADRFYGTADLISLCQGLGWDYRLRLKGNLVVGSANRSRFCHDRGRKTKTGPLADNRVFALQDVQLTASRAIPNNGIMRDPGHNEPCEIAERFARDHRHVGQAWLPDHAKLFQTLGIEPMFSTSSRAVSALRTRTSSTPTASPVCCSSGHSPCTAPSRPACGVPSTTPSPPKEMLEPTTREGRALQNLVVHPRPAPHHRATPGCAAAAATLVNVTDGWSGREVVDGSGPGADCPRAGAPIGRSLVPSAWLALFGGGKQ